MKLIQYKFAVTTFLLVLLAAPAAVFADGHGDDGNRRDEGGDGDWGEGRDRGGDRDKRHDHYAVPEPSTLIMTLAGMGLGIGLVAAGVRRNRRRTVAA